MNERTLSAWTGTFSWVGFEHPPTPWNHIFPPLGLKHTNCSPFHTKSSVGLFSFKNRLDLIIPHKLLMGFTWFEISRLLDYTSWLWFMSVSLSAMFCLKGARMSITGCSHFWTIGCGTTVWSFWLGAVGSGSASLNSDMTEIGSWFYASKDWQVVVIFLRFSPWIIATVSTIHHYALLHFLHIYPPQSILWLALNLPTLLFLTSHKLIHSTISKWLCFLFASKFILNQELNFALNCFFFVLPWVLHQTICLIASSLLVWHDLALFSCLVQVAFDYLVQNYFYSRVSWIGSEHQYLSLSFSFSQPIRYDILKTKKTKHFF